MAVHVGVTFAIDGVNCARKFKIRQFMEPLPAYASSTQQGPARECGNKDFTGRYWAYGHTPAVMPGDSFTFQAVTDASKGLQGTAMVKRVTIFWPVEKGWYIHHIVDVEGNGALTFTGAATDSGNPVESIVCAESLGLSIGGVAVSHVRNMQLAIEAANRPYVSSTTGPIVNRNRGNLDCQWAVQTYEHDPSALPAIGTVGQLLFECGTDGDWEVNWGKVLQVPDDYGADHESLENIWGTIAGAWTAHVASGTGSLVTPADATIWPYS